MTFPDRLPSDAAGVLPGEHLHALRGRLTGDLFLPGDDGWDAARQAWQLLADQHPTAVVVAADVQDVVTTVLAARRLGLHVAPQSTGHAARTIPSLEDTILLRTTRLDDVRIDPVAQRARVGAGATWGQVSAAAAAHGLAGVSGMAATVGVVGFSLGGGLGWLARSHGLGSGSIRAIHAVDAHGRIVRIDADHHADLFWAARGGAAPVVVTEVELQLHPIEHLVAGSLLWPIERAADIAHAWRGWIAHLPESVTSLLRVLRYPPIPEIPEPLRGRSFVGVEAAIQTDEAAADALLRPLRALAPEIDTVASMSPAELGAVHGDPPQPSPAYSASLVLAEVSEEAIETLVDALGDPASVPLLSVEVRHLGGRLVPGGPGGVVTGIDGEGLVFAVGIVPVPAALHPVESAAATLMDRLAPYASTAVVRNFREGPVSPAALLGADLERVRAVARSWDPERIIRTGHPVE
jgi:FAD/FMN-containing dehydrogenase